MFSTTNSLGTNLILHSRVQRKRHRSGVAARYFLLHDDYIPINSILDILKYTNDEIYIKLGPFHGIFQIIL